MGKGVPDLVSGIGTNRRGGVPLALGVLLLALVVIGVTAAVWVAFNPVHRGGPVADVPRGTGAGSIDPNGSGSPSPWIAPLEFNETAGCAAINSNTSLNSTIEEIYRGLPNVSQTWGPGSNSTAPTGADEYPPEATAEERLTASWDSICSSASYGQNETRWGADNLTGGLALNGSTGDYQVNFGVYWHGACENATLNSDGYCQHSVTWYVDLVTWLIDGPVAAESGGPPTGWGPPPAFPFGLDNASNVSSGGRYWYNFTVSYVDPPLLLDGVGIEVKTFDCAPVANVLVIQFSDPSGSVVGSENLTMTSWGAANDSAIAVGDVLSLQSRGSLQGDELDLAAAGGSQGFIIAGTGGWEGCSF
jgi:hypothetical protein